MVCYFNYNALKGTTTTVQWQYPSPTLHHLHPCQLIAKGIDTITGQAMFSAKIHSILACDQYTMQSHCSKREAICIGSAPAKYLLA